MTDNDIIKDLEDVLTRTDAPVGEFWGVLLTTGLLKETIDLINRQKADIERLQSMNQSKLDMIHDLRAEIERLQKTEYILPARACGKTQMVRVKLDEIRTEAIKEFAERVKEKAFPDDSISCEMVVYAEDIDNIAKEMVGERE